MNGKSPHEAIDSLKGKHGTGKHGDRRDVPRLSPPRSGNHTGNPKPSLSADRVIPVIFFLWLDCRVS